MLPCARSITTLECRAASCFQQRRTVRTKAKNDFYTNAQHRDERLLKRLEAQLAQVQAKIKKEEIKEAELMKKQINFQEVDSAFKGDRNLKGYNLYFWEKVLSVEDRKELAGHGITSFDDLFSAHEAAEAKMSRPPHPLVSQLEPRLRHAHNLYQSIPERLNEAQNAKSKSFFSRWL